MLDLRSRSDARAVRRVLSGNREAFGTLVTRYHSLVYHVALSDAATRTPTCGLSRWMWGNVIARCAQLQSKSSLWKRTDHKIGAEGGLSFQLDARPTPLHKGPWTFFTDLDHGRNYRAPHAVSELCVNLEG